MTVCKVGGIPSIAQSTAQWRLTPGVAPVFADFDFTPKDAALLLNSGLKPLTVEMKGAGGKVVRIQNLYVIHEVSSDPPTVRRLRLADRRYFWKRNHIKQSFNVRRNTAFKRLSTPATTVTSPVKSDTWYAPYSLSGEVRSSRPWTAREILERIIDAVRAAEPNAAPFTIDAEVGVQFDNLPVENLELDDSAEQALMRVLAYLPGAQITVDQSGAARVYSVAAFSKSSQVESRTRPEIQRWGTLTPIELGRIRPKDVEVLFTREIEVRLDFVEAGGETVSVTAESATSQFEVKNVLPVPDFALGDYVQGTWIPIVDALVAWGAPPFLGKAELDVDDLRRAMVPFLDFWGPLRLAGSTDPDADWFARISALQAHYRQTFQIDKGFMDQISSWRAQRVAILDPEDGRPIQSPVYVDYAVIATQKSMLATAAGQARLEYAENVTAQVKKGSAFTESARVAPATIQILDHDQGVFRINFQPADEFRKQEHIIPGNVNNVPSFDLQDTTRNWVWNGFKAGSPLPELATGFNMTTIISVIPAYPNDERQLHKVKVTEKEAAKVLPGSLRSGGATGPTMQVRIGAGVETARIGWADEKRADVERALGLREGLPNLVPLNAGSGDTASLSELGASVDLIAVAAAARVYAEFTDRHHGTRKTNINSAARVDGWIDTIQYEVGVDGVATTEIRAKDQADKVALLSLLGPDVRRTLLRLARPNP